MAGEMMKEEDAVATAAAEAAAAACKTKILSARRRRQELMRIRSDNSGGGYETKWIRNKSSPPCSDSYPPPDPEAAGAGGSGSSGEETAGDGGGHVRRGACSSYGHVSVVGRRREMEDAVAVVPGMAGGWLDFFGVYDGHGGAQVAVACSERMHVVLDDVAGGDWPDGGNERWREVMGECFGRVDVEAGEAAYRTVGSTAVVAVVGPTAIVVANCGDSRAVLFRDGLAVPLSQDHKPDRPDELERVEAAGGRVINWGGYRIIGVLATSRSIGDYYLKPYVISEPEVTITNRTEKDEFLILASDGLWDVISNEMACKTTRQCLNGRAARMFPHVLSGSSASEAAAFLAELAMSRGSKDNISIVVVNLKRFSNGSSH